MRLAIVLLLAGTAAVAVGACTLFDDDLPDDSCKTDEDCFRAQGERCNTSTRRCELAPMVDAGVDAP